MIIDLGVIHTQYIIFQWVMYLCKLYHIVKDQRKFVLLKVLLSLEINALYADGIWFMSSFNL